MITESIRYVIKPVWQKWFVIKLCTYPCCKPCPVNMKWFMKRYRLEGGHINHRPYISVLSPMMAYAMLPSGSFERSLLSYESMLELNILLGAELPRRLLHLLAWRLILNASALRRWYSLFAIVFCFAINVFYVIFCVRAVFTLVDWLVSCIFAWGGFRK